jgi:sugar transferase (PEP-CTERM/EpsH1 system associated)
MRILFLAHRFPYPPTKGDKIRSFWELRYLAARNEVDLFCFFDDLDDEKLLGAASEFCTNLYAEKLSWWRSRSQSLWALLRGRAISPAYFYSQTMRQKVRNAINSRNYDLIFVYCSSMVQYVPSGFGGARILDMVDVDSDKWAQYGDRSSTGISWLWKLEARHLAELERSAIEDFSAILVCTDQEAAALQRTGASQKIMVLENHLDTNYFDPGKVEVPTEVAGWQPYIIFTGSMDYYPNVDAVTYFHRKVFPFIRDAYPQARLVIGGRNPARAVRRLARDTAVLVTGSVSDMRPYLRGASAAVAPLRIARGVQNKILEAMAMGLAVAVSSQAAKALPKCLLPAIRIEDNPRLLAEFLVRELRKGAAKPKGEVREAVLKYFGTPGGETRLEDVICRAIRFASRKVQLSAHDLVEKGEGISVPLRCTSEEGTEVMNELAKRDGA